eukprot:364400-Chlamydomonas_euryale.AAC.5
MGGTAHGQFGAWAVRHLAGCPVGRRLCMRASNTPAMMGRGRGGGARSHCPHPGHSSPFERAWQRGRSSFSLSTPWSLEPFLEGVAEGGELVLTVHTLVTRALSRGRGRGGGSSISLSTPWSLEPFREEDSRELAIHPASSAPLQTHSGRPVAS